MKNISKAFILFAGFLLLQTNTAWSMARRLPGSDGPPVVANPPPVKATPAPISQPPPSDVSTSTDVTPLWEGRVADGKEWSTHVDRELDHFGQSMLDVTPADASLFCPKYHQLSYSQRKQYWTFLISSMVRFESNFKPQTSYQESFNDSNGNPVISRGLLQLSIESAKAYGCDLNNAQELHDPYKNLTCGVRILNRWVGRDGRVAGKVDNSWRGGARYWSVLRAGDKTSYKSIVSWSRNLSICK